MTGWDTPVLGNSAVEKESGHWGSPGHSEQCCGTEGSGDPRMDGKQGAGYALTGNAGNWLHLAGGDEGCLGPLQSCGKWSTSALYQCNAMGTHGQFRGPSSYEA